MDRVNTCGKLGDLVVLVGRDPFYGPLAQLLWDNKIAVLRVDRGEALPTARDKMSIAVVYRPDQSGTEENRIERWAEALSPVRTYVKLGPSDVVVATVEPRGGGEEEEWIAALPSLVERAVAVVE